MRVHAKFSGQLKTDFGFTARLGFRKEERGLRSQRQKKFFAIAARTAEPYRSARTRVREKRNWAEWVARNAPAHEVCKRHCRRGGRRVPTLPSQDARRAGRRWPRFLGKTE